MRRLAGKLVAVAAAVTMAACSSAGPAPATTTTTSVASSTAPDGSTTTTTTTEPQEGGEGFRTRTPGVLVIGTERLAPPWFTGPEPGLVSGGFEYRLGQEIGARLGVPVVKVVSTSVVLMMTGQDCKCDVIISGLTITDSRARTLDLTEPYLDVDQALLVHRGTAVGSLADAAALRLAAAVRDPAALDVIKNEIEPSSPTTVVVDQGEALRRMADGRVDGVVMDVTDALVLAHDDPSLVVAGRLRTGEQYAVALSLGSPNTALVNQVIRDMRDDGTIDNLSRAYLGVRPGDVPVLP